MRLCFGELSEAEQSARQRICERGRAAWSCLAGGDVQRAQSAFAEIDPRIELSVDRGSSAFLTALESSAWPLAGLLLAQAPSDLGYALSLGRVAQSLDAALDAVKAAHGVELSRAALRAGFSRGHLLEITLSIPGGTGQESEQIAAENLVCALLGERLFETWIGAVHAAPAPRVGPLRVFDAHAVRGGLQLHELFETVAAAALGVLRALPDAPHAASTGRAASALAAQEAWTMLEVEPLSGARGVRKDDLLLASTCTPELLRCFLDGSPCSSRRFSRAGEHFVFLSYADEERASERRVARRSQIESALAECLLGEGAVTGVGLGLKTSYIDFALCDLETGLGRLVSKSRELGMPAHSFIQFFDSELSEEWLSISPESRLA